MSINISLGTHHGKIEGLNIEQITMLSDCLSFAEEGYQFKQAHFKKKFGSEWDGVTRLLNSATGKFPIGLFPRVCAWLNSFGFAWSVHDTRKRPSFNLGLTLGNVKLRSYQEQVVMSTALNSTGVVQAATGSGKTTMAVATIAMHNMPTVFLVHTLDLLQQAKDTFERTLGIHIGQLGGGVVDLDSPVVVATVQTLSQCVKEDFYEKYAMDEELNCNDIPLKSFDRLAIMKWANTIQVVMFDEVQRVASRTAYAARFMFNNAYFAYGYSASPWRDDGADLMIEGACGPVISKISASELIKQGHLMQPRINIKTAPAINLPLGAKYSTVYKHGIVENIFRNEVIVNDALTHYRKGRNTLILVTQIRHGKNLEAMLRHYGQPAQFISGKTSKKIRRDTIQDMRDGKAPLVIASTIADVGLDVPRLEAVVEAGAGKSSVTALQRVGRIMRTFEGKKDCFFTTYRDNLPFIYKHIEGKLEIWRTESEFIIEEE